MCYPCAMVHLCGSASISRRCNTIFNDRIKTGDVQDAVGKSWNKHSHPEQKKPSHPVPKSTAKKTKCETSLAPTSLANLVAPPPSPVGWRPIECEGTNSPSYYHAERSHASNPLTPPALAHVPLTHRPTRTVGDESCPVGRDSQNAWWLPGAGQPWPLLKVPHGIQQPIHHPRPTLAIAMTPCIHCSSPAFESTPTSTAPSRNRPARMRSAAPPTYVTRPARDRR